MSKQTILDRYTALLKAYVLQPDERHLAAVTELSREMIQADMSLETIIEVHLEILQRLAQERPDMTLPDTLSLVSPFLQQLMPAGDLAHRKRLAASKQMVESLRQSAAEYRAIFETTGTAMMIVEEDTTISLLNTESEKLYGYSREEIEGKRSWTEFVVPDDLERMKEYHRLRRVDPNLAPHNYEFRLIDKHGAVKDILLFIDMIPGTRKSVASLLDITQRKRAEEALKRRATQLAAVAKIGRQMATFLALDTLLEQVVSLIREEFGYRYVSLFLVDLAGEELVLRAGAGYEIEPAKVIHLKIGAEGICGWVAAHGEPLLVGDVSQEPRYYPLDILADTRSELAVPIRAKGQVTGVLDVLSTKLEAFDAEDILILQLLSDQVAVALENTRLFEAEQRRRQEAETLRETALALTTSLERDEVIERILIQLREVVPYDSASVQLLQDEHLEVIGTYGCLDPEKILGITFDLAAEDVPNVKVMSSRAPLILKDAPANYDKFKQAPHTRHIHGWLGVPLLVGDRAVGMLALDKHEPGFYTEEHAQLALAFAAQAAIAIENAHLYERAQQEIAERQRAEEEARTSESQKSSLLETIPHAVIGLQERRIVFANPGVEAVFGWQPEELLGKTARQLYRSQEEYEEIGEHFYPKLERQATHCEEFPCRRKDDRDITCMVSASRIGERLKDKRIVVVYEDITERKRMEEALDHRLIALTQPAGEVGELQLTDIIDVELLQELQNRFAKTHNVASVIFKPDGTPITRPSNFSKFCRLIRSTSKGAKDCQVSDATLVKQCNLEGPCLSHCATFEEILSSSVPIIVGDRHVANWGIGQGVTDRLDEDKVRWYAGEIGVDEKQLVSAARELPAMSREQSKQIVQFLSVIVQHIALLGLQNLQQARDIAARQQSEKALRETTDTLEAQNTRLAALQRVGQMLNSTLDVEAILDCLTDEALRVTSATHGQVLVVRKGSGYFERRSLRGFSPQETELARTVLLPLDKGINGRVYATAQTIRVADVRDEPDYFPLIPATRAELGVPIVREGEVLGNLDLQSPMVGAFRDVDLEYLLALADQAAIAIENARLYQQSQELIARIKRRGEELEALRDISLAITAQLELDELLQSILKQGCRLLDVSAGGIYLVDEMKGDLQLAAGHGYMRDYSGIRLSPGEGICGKVLQSGEPLVVDDYHHWEGRSPSWEAEPITANISVPFRHGERIIGVMGFAELSRARKFDKYDVRLAALFADQAAVAIANARLFQAEQEQRELAESLAEAAAAVGSTLDSDEVLDHILEQVARVVPGDVFNIMLLERDAVRAVRWRGYDRLGIEEQIAGFTISLAKYPNFTRMVESGKTVFVSDTTAAPDWVMEAGQEWRRSYIGAPIQAEGVTIGFLNADGTRTEQFSPADAQRLEAFAGHAAIAIENARLYQQSQELIARITRLYELSLQINESLSLEEALELVVWQVIKAADAHSAAINLLDQEGRLEFYLGMGAAGEPQENISPPRSSGTTMSVYRTGEPLMASDLEEEDPLLHPSLRNKGIKAFIGLPLRTRERCTGVLFVRYTESHSFSEEEVQALSLFANQAAVALENARLYHAAQLARERADALREISRVVGSTLELDEVLSLVLRQAKRVLTYDSASILLFADDQPAMAAVIGYEDDELVKTEVSLRLGDSPILQSMACDRQPILIADVREDERWIWVPGAENVRAWLGVPLLVRGEMIGVLMVDSTQPSLYTAADVAIAQSLADQVAVAIDNARLYTSLEQEKARLELLYRLGRQLSESLDVHDVAQRALDEICTVVGAMRGITLVRELDRARLQLVAVSGYTAESVATLDRRMQLVVGNGLVGWVMTKRSPVLVSDVLQDEHWLPVSGFDDGVRSALSVPLFSGDEAIGAFSIYSDRTGFFNDDHRQLVESVATTMSIAIQNAQLYEQAQHRLEILNNLNRASQALTSSLEVQKVLEQIVELAGSVVNSDYTSVALLDEKGHLALEVEDFRGLSPLSRRLRPSGVTHQVLESGQMLVMDEIAADGTITPPLHHSNGELLQANPSIVAAGIRSAVAAPIQIKGKTLGVLFVHSRTPRAFQGQLTLLSTFANQAAVALENARLYEQAQQEIAERKRAQDALQASEEQYRLLTETARDLIVAHDMTGRITYANPAAWDASGYDEEEFRRLNIAAFLPPEQLPAMQERAAQRAAGDAGLHVFEADLRTKSGRLLPVEIGSSLLLEQDRPVGVLLIARDITERRRAQEALRRRATQLATLGEVGQQLASLLPLGPLLERIVNLIREAFSYRYVVILLVDPLTKTLELKAVAGFEVERLRPLGLKIGEEGICGWVAASGEPLLVNDVSQEPRYYALGPLPDTRSELAVPIRVQDQVVGVLDVQSTKLNAFDQADLFTLQTLADQAAVAIENARLFQAEQEQRELAESLAEAAAAIGSTLELDEVLDRLLEQVDRVLPGDACNVMLIEEDIARVARWRGYQRFDPKKYISTATFPLAEAVNLQQMVETGKPMMISDTATYPGWVQVPAQAWLRAYLGAPIQVGGMTVGFLNVDGSRPGQFDSADARRLKAFAHHAATAIENAGLYQELRLRAAQLEERVTERTAQLQAQYARLDALLRSISDGILVTDAQGDLIQTNPIAQRWLTQTLSPMDAERLQMLVHNLARRAQERPEAVLELTGLDLQLNAAPILERAAEKATAVVVAHDVSHIKALERMKSRFVTNVSHELRTPITTIKLYVALLQQKPEKWEKYLDALTQESEHLARLVEDVLQVSRIDDGRLEIHPQSTFLNVLTELIVSKHQVLARSSEVTLSYQPAAPDPLALADPDQLTQALNNLVRNALHYTPEGGKVTVSTGTAESRGQLWATITVADTGMGIPPEELSHIFERFFRGQQPQSLQLSGSGLGLAIVHEIVELHGGRVTVDSQVGAGSTFTIWLPLLKE